MPLVSIIIPCHNAAKWLAEAVDSALAQTWPRKEILVIDDGSTDDSLAIAQSYGKHRVIALSQPKRGASAARNAGLQAAQGAYIQFLDADDLLAPEKIERQMARLASASAGHIASGEWGRFTADPGEVQFLREPNWRDLSGLEFLLLHYEAGWMMQPAAWLCPRSLLEEVGPWDERLTLNDDGEYFGRVVLASDGILFCEGARCFYRSNLCGSLSRRKDSDALRSLWLSTELNCERLLATGHTSRVRAAAANGWQRLAFECYPTLPELAAEAEARCRKLGGSPFPIPAGRNFQRLAGITGWRTAKRLRDLWFRMAGI